MKNNKICKICNKFSGKRNVCLICKIEQPFTKSNKGQEPFRRVKK